jgi:hypothetical protein
VAHYCLVTGGREPEPSVRNDIEAVLRLLKGLHGPQLRVMHGAARGVDTWAAEICEQLDITCKGFPADWEGRGRSAGTQRNVDMITKLVSWLALGHTAQVVAFPGGRGTSHCATTAEKSGLDVSWIVATEPGRAAS